MSEIAAPEARSPEVRQRKDDPFREKLKAYMALAVQINNLALGSVLVIVGMIYLINVSSGKWTSPWTTAARTEQLFQAQAVATTTLTNTQNVIATKLTDVTQILGKISDAMEGHDEQTKALREITSTLKELQCGQKPTAREREQCFLGVIEKWR